MSEEHPYQHFIGKRVLVIWTDDAYNRGSDWLAFRVIDACCDGLWLQGVADPEGNPHDGTKCFSACADFRDVLEWKEGE